MGGLREEVRRTLDFLKFRKTNYQLAFGLAKVVSNVRRAFRVVFGGGPAGQAVLRDLEKFCRANETCFHEDARMNLILEGRREVWLRIQQHLNLNPDDLFQLYSGRDVTRLMQQENDHE